MNFSRTGSVDRVRALFQEIRPDIEHNFLEIWRCPELPGMEFHATDTLAQWLEKEGFEVERNKCGIPTAFSATWGNGKPVVGLLAEYDALPGVDNDATPYRKSLGNRAGHGCGHNHIGSANIGAAITAKRFLEATGGSGTIKVIGCPAEEIVWGKIALLERTAFEDIDVLLTSHGDYQNGVMSRPCQAVWNGEVRFKGASGHGGNINQCGAMDALEVAMQTVTRLRANHFPDTIVRSVIRKGGDCPVVVPDETSIWFSTRTPCFDKAKQVYEFIMDICQRVADMCGVEVSCQYISATHGYLPNDEIAETLYRNMEIVGPPVHSDEHLVWLNELANAVRPGDSFTLDRDIALYNTGTDSYGQDDGEVSWHIPLGRINWAVPEEVPLHHWAYTAMSGHKAGFAGPLMAAEVLALSTIELLENPDIVSAAQKELERRRGQKVLRNARVGAFKSLTENPESFWDASWSD